MVWDVLELNPREYPAGIWPWSRCHVQHGGTLHTFEGQGHFIRRYEFDDFLLRRSGAEFAQHSVRKIERRGTEWVVDGRYRAKLLVGAGGTHCPVSRQLFSDKRSAPVAARELEFVAGSEQVSAARVGRDGEPELFLHDDLAGYSWNVPKGEWLNVGTGTSEPRDVLAAWSSARDFFVSSGHLPEGALTALEGAKGHAYYLFNPEHLEHCQRSGAVLVGDSLGLAHPLTAEGILPALLSGTLAADAASGAALSAYPAALAGHPLMRDYALASELLAAGIGLRNRMRKGSWALPRSETVSRLSRAATAKAFAWLFSGRPIPHARLLRALLRRAHPASRRADA
jgi:flavin-dependent dehydrogenase